MPGSRRAWVGAVSQAREEVARKILKMDFYVDFLPSCSSLPCLSCLCRLLVLDRTPQNTCNLQFNPLFLSEKSSFVKEQKLATLSNSRWTRTVLELQHDSREC